MKLAHISPGDVYHTIHENEKPHRTLYLPNPDDKYPEADKCHKRISGDWGRGHQCHRNAVSMETHQVLFKDGEVRTIQIPVCKVHEREYLIAKDRARDSKWRGELDLSRAKGNAQAQGRALLAMLVRLTPAQVDALPEKVREARARYTDALEAVEGLTAEQDVEAQGGDAMDRHREATT